MPRPRITQSYPSVYATMLEIVATRGETLRHPCADNKAAQRLRFTFYDYLKACRRSVIPRDLAVADMAAGLMFTIEDNFLVISPRDTSGEALELQKSLDKYMGQKFQEASVTVPRSTSKQANPLAPDMPTPSAGPSQEELINSYMAGKKK